MPLGCEKVELGQPIDDGEQGRDARIGGRLDVTTVLHEPLGCAPGGKAPVYEGVLKSAQRPPRLGGGGGTRVGAVE